MTLSHRVYGDGTTVVLLHGLLGSRENWHSFAETLAGFRVVVPDLRNHGSSRHAEAMDYPSMAEDVVELLDSIGANTAQYVGHSMGGKVAMEIALTWPRRVTSLVVEDMVPGETSPRYRFYLNALKRMDLSQVRSRRDAEELLERDVPDRTVRLFLLKNLERSESNGYRWRAGLDAIAGNYDNIWRALEDGRTYDGPCVFVRGGQSDTVSGEREQTIEEYFPNAELKTIEAAGHWVHATEPEAFASIVVPFLRCHADGSGREPERTHSDSTA